MRTKTLLLTAALAVAGIATSKAQSVYSVNAVGYVNLSLTNGFNLIANPLNSTNNNITNILSGVPDFTSVYRFNPATQLFFNSANFVFGTWDIDFVLNPGEGVFIELPSPTTLTFIGEVPQGNLTNVLSANFALISSIVPQAGGLTALGYPAEDFDTVFRFNPATQQYYNSSTFLFGAWDVEPVIGVGESFWAQRSTPGQWVRTFSVNN